MSTSATSAIMGALKTDREVAMMRYFTYAVLMAGAVVVGLGFGLLVGESTSNGALALLLGIQVGLTFMIIVMFDQMRRQQEQTHELLTWIAKFMRDSRGGPK